MEYARAGLATGPKRPAGIFVMAWIGVVVGTASIVLAAAMVNEVSKIRRYSRTPVVTSLPTELYDGDFVRPNGLNRAARVRIKAVIAGRGRMTPDGVVMLDRLLADAGKEIFPSLEQNSSEAAVETMLQDVATFETAPIAPALLRFGTRTGTVEVTQTSASFARKDGKGVAVDHNTFIDFSGSAYWCSREIDQELEAIRNLKPMGITRRQATQIAHRLAATAPRNRGNWDRPAMRVEVQGSNGEVTLYEDRGSTILDAEGHPVTPPGVIPAAILPPSMPLLAWIDFGMTASFNGVLLLGAALIILEKQGARVLLSWWIALRLIYLILTVIALAWLYTQLQSVLEKAGITSTQQLNGWLLVMIPAILLSFAYPAGLYLAMNTFAARSYFETTGQRRAFYVPVSAARRMRQGVNYALLCALFTAITHHGSWFRRTSEAAGSVMFNLHLLAAVICLALMAKLVVDYRRGRWMIAPILLCQLICTSRAGADEPRILPADTAGQLALVREIQRANTYIPWYGKATAFLFETGNHEVRQQAEAIMRNRKWGVSDLGLISTYEFMTIVRGDSGYPVPKPPQLDQGGMGPEPVSWASVAEGILLAPFESTDTEESVFLWIMTAIAIIFSGWRASKQ